MPKIGDRRIVDGVEQEYGIFGEWETYVYQEPQVPVDMVCAGSSYDRHCNRFFESDSVLPKSQVEQMYALNGHPIERQCSACYAKDERASNCDGATSNGTIICHKKGCPGEVHRA